MAGAPRGIMWSQYPTVLASKAVLTSRAVFPTRAMSFERASFDDECLLGVSAFQLRLQRALAASRRTARGSLHAFQQLVALVALMSCAGATTSSAVGSSGLGGTARAKAEPPARITFAPRRRTLALKDRLTLFDRVGFSFPSSVAHDRERDLYWVSNLNTDGPGGKGFISRLQPDGSLSTLNFIDGRKEGVELAAPHGLAVSGSTLYVADVTAIRRFDADTGAPQASIQVPDARHLSDVAVATDGSLYVADVGSEPSIA